MKSNPTTRETSRADLTPQRRRRLYASLVRDPRVQSVLGPELSLSKPATYWTATQRPAACLALVAPLMVLYEVGLAWAAGGDASNELRAGADAWIRVVLGWAGLRDRWFAPLLLTLVLAAWQAVDRRNWRVRGRWLLGMIGEGCLLGVVLVGAGRLLDLGFDRVERGAMFLDVETARASALWLGFLGAGLYEEALFRLALVPIVYGLARALYTPKVIAVTLAMTGSGLLFALAHHVGAPGEAFTWFAFIFRWLAGVYFAAVFVIRGFGVAVAAHIAYDLLVGGLGWHF